MAIAVSLIPAKGGLVELGTKAAAGALAYAVLAVALDVGEARSQIPRILRAMQARLASAT
jgi:hypothetical protein